MHYDFNHFFSEKVGFIFAHRIRRKRQRMLQNQFRVLGLSYRKAPVEVRERLSLDDKAANTLLATINETLNTQELLILSTCNRTEVYFSSDSDLSLEIIKLICLNQGITNYEEVTPYFVTIDDGKQATEHLFRVALGLEAQVLGDLQIINQIKRAYQAAADNNTVGPFLHRALHTIFFANKRVFQETAFRDGAASVSYAASEMANTFAKSFDSPKALVIGLGEIGMDVAKHLAASPIELTVTNRSQEKIDELNSIYDIKSIELDTVAEALKDFDIIISGVSAKHFIDLEKVQNYEHSGIQYFFDLSVPRSIDPNVASKSNIQLYNIDDIQDKTSKAVQKRKNAIPEVELIMMESMRDLFNWSQEMEVSPTIKKLKNALEDIRQDEIKKHLKNATPEMEAFADKLSKSITQKIMKLPVLQLKAACKRGEAETLIDVLNDLFDLEKQPVEK